MTDEIAALYDALAVDYDEVYATPEDYHEDGIVQEMLWPLVTEAETVLDVGCGTGLLLDLHAPRIDPAGYLGVDVSAKMVDRLERKHPLYDAMVADVNETIGPGRWNEVSDRDFFDLAVAMYGSPTYLKPSSIDMLLERALVSFLMFTQPGYVPRIHDAPVPTATSARLAAMEHRSLARIEVVGEHVVTIHRRDR